MPSRPERVLITGARAPVALHMARLLARAGCHVVMADSLRHCIGYVSDICRAHEILPPFNSATEILSDAMGEVVKRHGITHILPTCEEVLYLARAVEAGQHDTQFLAPSFAKLEAAHNKAAFIGLAGEAGLPVPETHLLRSTDDIAALESPTHSYVFKPIWSRFGTGTLIRPNALRIRPTEDEPWVAQAYLAGALACAYAVADAGRVRAMAIYEPRYPAGQGGGTAFQRISSDPIADHVARFVAHTNWTGQISFDFIQTTDGPVPIECNPRATSGLHLFDDGPDFARALFDGAVIEPKATGLHGVRMAMAVFGLWPALKHNEIMRFYHDLRNVNDVIADRTDPRPARQQWRAFAELTWLAWRKRISLQTATTDDIAWDGAASTTQRALE